MEFSEIIGHNEIKNQIMRAIDNNKLAHAHLILGQDGIGKSKLADAMTCRILRIENQDKSPDIVSLKRKKDQKSIGVEAIRQIIDEINKKPSIGDKKVIVIYDAHMMTEGAQNALLKTIEEPPNGVFIILLCEKSELILDTIKSRCQIHILKALNKFEIKKFIQSKYPNLNDEEMDAVIAFSSGIPGEVEKFMEDEEFKKIRECVLKAIITMNHISSEKLVEYEEAFEKHKSAWEEILNCALTFIRDAMIFKESGKREFIINKDKIKNIQELANIFSYRQLNDIIDIIENTMSSFRKNVNMALNFELMLLKLQEV